MKAIDELLLRAPNEIGPELMAHFTLYLALQLTRGRRHRQMQRDTANRVALHQFGELTDAGTRHVLERRGLPVTGGFWFGRSGVHGEW